MQEVVNELTVNDGQVSVKTVDNPTPLTDEQKAELNKAIEEEMERISELYNLVEPAIAENLEVFPVDTNHAEEVFAQFDNLCAFTEAMQGIGLSASQLGVDKQYFVYRDDNRYWNLVFNPKFYPAGETRTTFNEGCLTYPDKMTPVKRWKVIKAHYQVWDKEKKALVPVQKTLRGLEAIIFQHESNHCGFPTTNGKNKSITIFTRK
jgi:peptide deformylase